MTSKHSAFILYTLFGVFFSVEQLTCMVLQVQVLERLQDTCNSYKDLRMLLLLIKLYEYILKVLVILI